MGPLIKKQSGNWSEDNIEIIAMVEAWSERPYQKVNKLFSPHDDKMKLHTVKFRK